MEGRAQHRLDEQITPPGARLREEPEIVQVPGLLDDEQNHAAQAPHLQNRRRRPHHRPNLIRLVSVIIVKRFSHPLFLFGWAALYL